MTFPLDRLGGRGLVLGKGGTKVETIYSFDRVRTILPMIEQDGEFSLPVVKCLVNRTADSVLLRKFYSLNCILLGT